MVITKKHFFTVSLYLLKILSTSYVLKTKTKYRWLIAKIEDFPCQLTLGSGATSYFNITYCKSRLYGDTFNFYAIMQSKIFSKLKQNGFGQKKNFICMKFKFLNFS